MKKCVFGIAGSREVGPNLPWHMANPNQLPPGETSQSMERKFKHGLEVAVSPYITGLQQIYTQANIAFHTVQNTQHRNDMEIIHQAFEKTKPLQKSIFEKAYQFEKMKYTYHSKDAKIDSELRKHIIKEAINIKDVIIYRSQRDDFSSRIVKDHLRSLFEDIPYYEIDPNMNADLHVVVDDSDVDIYSLFSRTDTVDSVGSLSDNESISQADFDVRVERL